MKTQAVSSLQKIAGGTAFAAVAVVAGYSLRDAGAQSSAVKPVAPQAGAPAVQTPAIQSAAQMQTAFAEVARVAEPAVVTITTAKRETQESNLRRFRVPSPGDSNGDLEDLFRQFRGMTPNSYKSNGDSLGGYLPIQNGSEGEGGSFVETGVGSGVIYDKSGLILTNAHVVEDSDRVSVKLLDGREFKNAKVLGVDTRTDIAVVKIPLTDAPAVILGDSERVRVGDWAIAVGNPFGLSNTLTVGVISASAREVNLAENGSLNDYLQTDASINPGNSGGPLLDIYGRVIGINNAIYSRSGGNVGIGFAIPINVARGVADSLVKDGRVHRAIIGVSMKDIVGDTAAFGLPADTKGVIVERVLADTPAARAGVQIGDVITAWNGEPVARIPDLQRKVAASAIGKPGQLTVLRGGKTQTLTVTPTEQTAGVVAGEPASPVPATQPMQSKLGVALAPLDTKARAQFRIPASVQSGVVVGNVVQGSPAARAGITPGDVIQKVGQTVVNAPADVDRAKDALLKAQTGGTKSVALYVVKPRGDAGFVVLQIGE